MEINDMQPVYECIKKIPGISPMSIRYCRAAGTDVCDRDCGVYAGELKNTNPPLCRKQDSI